MTSVSVNVSLFAVTNKYNVTDTGVLSA